MNNSVNYDPVNLVVQEMQDGTDTLTALERAAAKHPEIFPASKMDQARMLLGIPDKEQFNKVVNNMAAERGMTLENVIRNLGIQIPSKR